MSKEDTNIENPEMVSQNKNGIENGANVNTDEANASDDNTELEYESFSEEIDISNKSDNDKNKDSSLNEDKIRIQILEEQLDRTKEQMVRALADAENTRKRSVKEREDASKFAVSSFARDLINVADNLRRALDSISDEILEEVPQVKNLKNGIEATERELLRSFEKNGIIKTDPIDQKFDPNFHEVMFETPVPDKETGTIIQVMEPGYIINGRILRPARVGIAKNECNHNQAANESTHTIDTKV